MARHPSWMTVTSERHDLARGAWIIEFKLARFWWARPSFWIFWIRTRGIA